MQTMALRLESSIKWEFKRDALSGKCSFKTSTAEKYSSLKNFYTQPNRSFTPASRLGTFNSQQFHGTFQYYAVKFAELFEVFWYYLEAYWLVLSPMPL